MNKDEDVVIYEGGKELTPEQKAAAKAEIEAAAKRPYVYDPDCPLLTPEQLAEFKPVNFSSMEERAAAMRAAGVTAAAWTPEAVT
ncbi:hypothetical protein TREPR_0107 [Treponema primitia ZAS-2]|uniref:Uncharacterized protein n=1 Tax=Treponema primitia (strain ATCC BAA-887 / DSM 12427 / ZAS-2) TaxID=545694 RepID=F5YN95_TREPZ|nr:hypothetical protein [Treponema primitia]AEF83721.1 hypothetical protein TREPR_0107 [Treponema primitia ZAS-2]